MSRFDASAWAGMWPFTTSVTTSLPELYRNLIAAGISGAAVSPLNAVLAPEPMGVNLALIDQAGLLANDDFEIRVVPVLDPSLPGWERDLEKLLSEHDALIGAVKILPNYHNYAVDGSEAVALARAVTHAGLGLCVQVRMLDERAHHPLMNVSGVPPEGIVCLAEAVPGVRILACAVFQAELAAIAGAPNISVELSSIESGDTLANALAAVGKDRVLLGSHAPIYYPAASVAKVSNTASDAATISRINTLNAAAFLN